MARPSEICDPERGPDALEALSAAARAAGALALSVDVGSDHIVFVGDASVFRLTDTATAGSLSRFHDRVAGPDRRALELFELDGPGDVRVRLIGEDGRVRYARLLGRGRNGCWTGLLLPAGAAPDGARDRVEAEHALTRAVRRGEIVAHYQPIVALADRRLAGFEALARWDRPGAGVLTPDAFIGLAGELGLMGEMGRQVRASAAADLNAWRFSRAGLKECFVSVNATASELADPTFVETVLALAEGAGAPRGAYKLEISETEMMRDPDACLERLNALRAGGVGLVLDDFGTGYSSLARLNRFPFDVIKVDQYFVRAAQIDPSARTTIRSVVTLARNFSNLVVAEGVETEDSAALCAELGCDYAQGFLFAGALAPARAAEAIHDGLGARCSAPA